MIKPYNDSTDVSPHRSVRAFVILFGLLVASSNNAATAETGKEVKHFDFIVENGRVVDGTGNPWFLADIGINSGLIKVVGDLHDATSDRRVDVEGLIVAPGFIDIHSHADDVKGRETGLRSDDIRRSKALNIVTQGVTTIVVNPDGSGELNLTINEQRTQLKKMGVGPNVVLMAPHNAIRASVMHDDHRRAATEAEIAAMQSIVREAMEQGAWGLTTGLEYVPGMWSTTSELISLMEVVAPFGGVHISHMRSETYAPMWWVPSQHDRDPPQLLDAVREIIDIAEQTGTRGVISHMKVRGTTHRGQSTQVIELVEAARDRGIEIYGDQYPYNTSGSDGQLVLIPMWSLGLEERPGKGETVEIESYFRQVLDNPAMRETLLSDIRYAIAFRGGAENIVIFDYPDSDLIGENLQALARVNELSPEEMAIELQLRGFPGRPGGARLRSFSFAESDIEALMSRPWVATSSDGGVTLAEDGPTVHARYNGAFPRKIARYVRERGTISLEFAVRAGTSLPAQILGLRDRGLLRPGMVADIVAFDENKIDDVATFTEPHKRPAGIEFVWIKGSPVVEAGQPTGALVGAVLHPAESGPGSL